MSLWIDLKYAKLLSGTLPAYKVKKTNPFTANCRCPICGDSATNLRKARGYLFEHKGTVLYKCHKCGASRNVRQLLEQFAPVLFREYLLDMVKERPKSEEEYVPDISKNSTPRFAKCEHLATLRKISQLPHDHPAKQYIMKRQIPSKFHYKLYYTPRFNHWVNTIIPHKLDDSWDEPRLVIPLIDREGYVFGFSGRSFNPKSSLRYITIMLDESKPKVFGLDTADFSKPVYVVEGPIDSMFIDNCIAMVGADIDLEALGEKNKFIVIHDNEPRSPVIAKKIANLIKNRYNVVLFPNNIAQKDINDMVLAGVQIQDLISKHTYSGLNAELQFNSWKRV